MPDKPKKAIEESDDEFRDCNVEGKSLVDSATGQVTKVDASDLIADEAIRSALEKLKKCDD